MASMLDLEAKIFPNPKKPFIKSGYILRESNELIGDFDPTKRNRPPSPPFPVRSDRQTTSLTWTTGVCQACTKWRGCEHHEYS